MPTIRAEPRGMLTEGASGRFSSYLRSRGLCGAVCASAKAATPMRLLMRQTKFIDHRGSGQIIGQLLPRLRLLEAGGCVDAVAARLENRIIAARMKRRRQILLGWGRRQRPVRASQLDRADHPIDHVVSWGA